MAGLRLLCHLLLIAFLAYGPAARAQVMQLRTFSQDAFAAKYNRGNSDRPGICVEIIRAVERIDPDMRFSGLDMKASTARIELALDRGQIDVFFGLIKTPERARRFVLAGAPLYSTSQVLVVRKDDPVAVSDWAAIRRLGRNGVILVNEGTGQARYLQEQGGLLIDDRGLTGHSNLQKLLLGRGRFYYVTDMYVSEELAAHHLADQVRILPLRFQREGLYIMFSKVVSPAVVGRVMDNVRKLERSGEMDRIRTRYFLGR